MSGTLQVPGDKSITHRAMIFAALSRGTSHVRGISPAEDCKSTARCLTELGMEISRTDENSISISAAGWAAVDSSVQQASKTLDAGNSGTTIRLLAGLLSGRCLEATFDGDESLRRRPMSRVLKHLQQMGANIEYLGEPDRPPFKLKGARLAGIELNLDVASAQVQTAILLAGLQASGRTRINLPAPVRDHTTRMFRHIGIPFESPNELSIAVSKLSEPIKPFTIDVPGDTSSAAFFMVAAACLPGSDLLLKNVCLNPGRILVIDVLKDMGAHIEIHKQRESSGEPVGDVRVHGKGRLQGTTIAGDRIAGGIDEIPILALAGALCNGRLSVRDAQELRVKESDRILAITENLAAQGAVITACDDGFDIDGQASLPGGGRWKSFDDHRLAMTGVISGLLCERQTVVDDLDCIAVSYPGFIEDLHNVCVN